MTRIFISYRRKAAAGQTGRLYDRLKKAFGANNVFMDVANIPPGETFESYILAEIDRCDVFLAMLADGTLDRIHEPDDWVRKEIAYALNRRPDLRVIPIQVDGFPIPSADDLPDELRDLPRINAAPLSHNSFENDARELIGHIRRRNRTSHVRQVNFPARLILGVLALAVVIGLIGFVASNLLNQPDDAPNLIADAPSATVVSTNPPLPTTTPTLTVLPSATATDVPLPTPTTAPTLTPSATTAPLGSSLDNPVTSNNQWTAQFETFDGVEMALVPAGCFMMGSTEEQIQYAIDELGARREWIDDETPAGEVCFDKPFWIDRYEVTNEQYGSIGCDNYSSEPDQPRNCVNWNDAKVHCEGRAVRLPTEAEWEYAARGPDAWVFPWGNEWNPDNANWGDTKPDETFVVGSFPAGESWVGAYDLSGNVWEWVNTIYDTEQYPYPYATDDGREDINRADERRVRRGGSFPFGGVITLRAAVRGLTNSGSIDSGFGFRCARSS
jgi:formylglycine-generating enzyme required for sulfatase activity